MKANGVTVALACLVSLLASALAVAAAPAPQTSSLKPTQWAMLPPLPKSRLLLPGDLPNLEQSPAETFQAVVDRIQQSFYGPRPDSRELSYAAARGMLSVLGDRYTRFLDPEEWRRMQEDSGGEFGGVGIGIRANARQEAEVASVTSGGSAWRAGVHVGDVLVRVGQVVLTGNRQVSAKAQDLVRGPEGTFVRLWLRRRASHKLYAVKLLRRKIQVPTVHYRMAARGVGVVTVDSFGKHTDSEIAAALRNLRKAGLRALILDLRGNPGGLFESAIEVSSRFVPSGTVVFTQDRDGRRMHITSLPNRRLKPALPLAVLVDHGSASASEIVAGAIKDSGAGVLVGAPTYGKAVVQTITPLKDGSAILVTTHHYYTPKGTDIGSRGLEPDYRVVVARLPKDSDPPLHRAMSVLMGQIPPAKGPVTRHLPRIPQPRPQAAGLPS